MILRWLNQTPLISLEGPPKARNTNPFLIIFFVVFFCVHFYVPSKFKGRHNHRWWSSSCRRVCTSQTVTEDPQFTCRKRSSGSGSRVLIVVLDGGALLERFDQVWAVESGMLGCNMNDRRCLEARFEVALSLKKSRCRLWFISVSDFIWFPGCFLVTLWSPSG